MNEINEKEKTLELIHDLEHLYLELDTQRLSLEEAQWEQVQTALSSICEELGVKNEALRKLDTFEAWPNYSDLLNYMESKKAWKRIVSCCQDHDIKGMLEAFIQSIKDGVFWAYARSVEARYIFYKDVLQPILTGKSSQDEADLFSKVLDLEIHLIGNVSEGNCLTHDFLLQLKERVLEHVAEEEKRLSRRP